ncbi:aspartyl-tRNA(Asn)/glutamyl-tRNA(Gln) amidotransferase subunit A [Kutzneria viridogrisea]|uniref:Aspartyl-tRNA(Asn)/glutamyl-tRNA(Gln) amidotransferase subunit A n=1 Tax=Kutzneria viridogrisea TaxID=47990 RepID=A0ABR6BE87_9PSEU|nr:aspartyl-tRNA(Asn)/glutamyl-tRNA(Gln) amidotransferase subunit A [Kutzneria viridogrisea]
MVSDRAVAAGMDPTPERLLRLDWALPFLAGSVEQLRALHPDENLAAAPSSVTRPSELGLVEAASAIHAGELTPSELVADCAARIAATEPALSAFARTAVEAARERADRLDGRRPTGPLHGIPYAAKDLIDTAGLATEYGSPVHAGRVPAEDAEVVRALDAAGGVLLGKTHTHQIAYGVATPQTRNPWDTTKMASGSSGGSAVALAARQVPAALGTDTGGSLRLPSAFCGTTAIKPTYGLVPGGGVRTLSWSYDVTGPMARDARDALLLLRVLTGQVQGDPRAVLGELPALHGARIGVPDEEFLALAQPEVVAALYGVGGVLADLGAQLVPVTPPPTSLTSSVSTVVVFKEAADLFGEHVRRGECFDEDIQSFLEAGLLTTVEDYLLAQRARRAVVGAYTQLLREVDAVLLPTSPITDLPHGTVAVNDLPLVPVLTPYTFPASCTGLPAVAFPCGFTSHGMPIGAQLLGPAFAETALVGVVHAYQSATDWHRAAPVLN